jgi:glycosyltransferase involved in cell wall biosynthesis
MSDIKLSLAIPYKQRLDNIKILFEGLANQTMDSSQFEVIVGVMEYCEEYVSACRDFTDRLNIISVLSANDFEVARARNLAMRQASGEVIVHLDADTLLAPEALTNLYEHNFSFGQNVCIVGQVLGYGNNMDGDVTSVNARSYAYYKKVLGELWDGVANPPDPRFQVVHVLPWAFAWTGLIALPAAAVRDHGLFFDEEFRGWGVEDLEWGYRICASGIPIVLRADVYGLHLPHVRDAVANFRKGRGNWLRFLRKWPRPDVELAAAFGDVDANSLFPEFQRELKEVNRRAGGTLGTISGTINGNRVIVIGASLGVEQRVIDPALLASFDDPADVEVLPLVGLGLPYEDASIDEVRVLPPVSGLPARYREAVHAEVQRVSKK